MQYGVDPYCCIPSSAPKMIRGELNPWEELPTALLFVLQRHAKVCQSCKGSKEMGDRTLLKEAF